MSWSDREGVHVTPPHGGTRARTPGTRGAAPRAPGPWAAVLGRRPLPAGRGTGAGAWRAAQGPRERRVCPGPRRHEASAGTALSASPQRHLSAGAENRAPAGFSSALLPSAEWSHVPTRGQGTPRERERGGLHRGSC